MICFGSVWSMVALLLVGDTIVMGWFGMLDVCVVGVIYC